MEVSRSWFVLVNKVVCFFLGGDRVWQRSSKFTGGGGAEKKLPKSSTKKRWEKAGKPNKNKNKEIQKHDNRKKPTYIVLKTPFVNKKTPLYIKHLRRKPPKPQNNKKNKHLPGQPCLSGSRGGSFDGSTTIVVTLYLWSTFYRSWLGTIFFKKHWNQKKSLFCCFNWKRCWEEWLCVFFRLTHFLCFFVWIEIWMGWDEEEHVFT